MDKPKFTPGDWVVGRRMGRIVVEGGCGETIAVLPLAHLDGFGLVDSEEVASNAQLIAEALNMHEALSGLLEQWKEFQVSSGNIEEAYYKLAKYARPHWEKAAAALSKANGEGQE